MSRVCAEVSRVAAPPAGALVQRKCGCGKQASSGTCPACRQEREHALRKPAAAGGHVRHGGNDFSRVPATTRRAVIVSAPDSPLEREADRIAEAVVGRREAVDGSQREPFALHPAGPGALAQRQALDDDDNGDDDGDDGDDDQGPVGDDSDLDVTSDGDESGRPKVRGERGAWAEEVALPTGGGRPLPGEVRRPMEGRIGYDFGHVRVHTDAGAGAAAAGLDAAAFTLGSDIYFGDSLYAPGSAEGDKLLAHELVHVAQQTGGGAGSGGLVQRQRRRHPHGPMDPPKGRGRGRQRGGKCDNVPACKGNCSGTRALPKNSCRRTPNAGNETCSTSGAADANNFIRHLDVNLATQMVVAEMGSAKAKTGTVGPFLSSPNPGVTPRGMHTIGIKCGACHTNNCADGMAWFTSFANGLEFGFHDSQRVEKGRRSHGCVRVTSGDGRDKWIHDNTASGKTTVCVHAGDHCGRTAASDDGDGGDTDQAPAEPAAPEPPVVAGDGGDSDGSDQDGTAVA